MTEDMLTNDFDTDLWEDGILDEIKQDTINSTINSYYESKKQVIKALDCKKGDGYSLSHPEEVADIVMLLEMRVTGWITAYNIKVV